MPASVTTPSTSPIIEIESQSRKLSAALAGDASLQRKCSQLIRFFRLLIDQESDGKFQSYFVEFAPWLPSFCTPGIYHTMSPADMEILITIFARCRLWLSNSELLQKLYEAEKTLHLEAALAYLYLGEPGSAAKVLDWPEGQNLSQHSSELATALAFVDLAQKQGKSFAPAFAHSLRQWQQQLESYSPDSITVLLVEKETPHDPSLGRLVHLHAQAKERPGDEMNRVFVNNSVPVGEASLYYSLLDSVQAVKAVVFSRQDRETCYTYHFSLSEKEAEFSGPSLGLAAGLAAFACRHNRHYRRPLVRLSNSAAVTGALTADGRITPLDQNGLEAKIQAAFFSPLRRVYVPGENLTFALGVVARLQNRFPNRYLEILGLHSLEQAVADRNLVERKPVRLGRRAVAALQRFEHKLAWSLVLMIVLSFAVADHFDLLQSRLDGRPAALVPRSRFYPRS
jgi:hypothetical protein